VGSSFRMVFRPQPVLRNFWLLPRVLGSTTREPMHIYSRIPRRPHS
jgi:hypothetical protein